MTIIDKLYEELREICRYDLEDIKYTLDCLMEKYKEEQDYEDNKEYYIQCEIDDRKYKEKRENE